MAPNRPKKQKPTATKWFQLLTNPLELFNAIWSFIFDPNQAPVVCWLLLPLEILVNLLIMLKVPYTEIDWKAYMQEVEGFLNGTYDYYQLKGDTGPLVYPAGFVYIYSLLYSITGRGTNLKLAQALFIVIYMIFIFIVHQIYTKTKRVPPIAMVIMSLTSHRIHSIFVLRLFNDPIAMLFFYASVLCLLKKWWNSGCILFSLAVSIKMNVLLFAPGLFFVLLLSHGFLQTIKYIILCALVQLILGAPFLLTFPVAYIHRSFDLGRQFFYIWTVNWKFLPEEIFLSRYFHIFLLAGHLIGLLLFFSKFLRKYGGLNWTLLSTEKTFKLSVDAIISLLFVSNYIGICFSRSLHYQFYVWYYHTFAYLLWSTKYSNLLRILIFGLVELCWNIYPSNFFSSLLLNACHATVLAGLWSSLAENPKL